MSLITTKKKNKAYVMKTLSLKRQVIKYTTLNISQFHEN